MIKVQGGWEDPQGNFITQAEMDKQTESKYSKFLRKKCFGYNRTMPSGDTWLAGDSRHVVPTSENLRKPI